MPKIRCCAAGITRVESREFPVSAVSHRSSDAPSSSRPDRPMLPIAGWAVECATRTVCAEPSIRTTRTRRQNLGPRDIPADESGFSQWPIGSDPAGNERSRQPHVLLSRHVTSKEVAVRSRSTINASAICRSSACPSLTPPVASICTPRLKVMMSATTPMAGNRSGSTS